MAQTSACRWTITKLSSKRVQPSRARAASNAGVVCFTGTGLSCRVARISQPYRLSGEWWGDEYARDYYIVLTREGQRAWAYLPAGAHDGWMLHGWFA